MTLAFKKHTRVTLTLLAILVLAAPEFALAQATSPFLTGANSLQTNILAWLTPVAIILVMILDGMAKWNFLYRAGDEHGKR